MLKLKWTKAAILWNTARHFFAVRKLPLKREAILHSKKSKKTWHLSLAIRILWSVISNAAVKSKSTTPTSFLSSIWLISHMYSCSAARVPWPMSIAFVSNPFLLKYLNIWLKIITKGPSQTANSVLRNLLCQMASASAQHVCSLPNHCYTDPCLFICPWARH